MGNPGAKGKIEALFTGHDPTNGSGPDYPTHGSGPEVFKISLVGPSWCEDTQKLTGRVGSVRVGLGDPIRPDPRALTRPVNSLDRRKSERWDKVPIKLLRLVSKRAIAEIVHVAAARLVC